MCIRDSYVTGGYDDPEFDYYGTVLGITDPPEGTFYSYLFNRLVDVDLSLIHI